MRIATQETWLAVRDACDRYGGLRPAARAIGGTDQKHALARLSDVRRHSSMSEERENVLRQELGLPPLPITEPTPRCPIHNVVHRVACDGEQGAAVWVHPAEKLIKAPGFGRARKERHTIEITDESVYAELLRWKAAIGGDWNQAVRAALWLAQGGRHDVDSIFRH